MELSNICDFIQKIYEDPLKKITGLTVRNYMQIQEHMEQCPECCRKVDEVLARPEAPKTDIPFSIN
jgi:hypothetical protein